MRKFKLTASALLVVSAIGLAGCGHQHTFSEKWSSNSTDHWHEATCEHAGQVVGDQAKHVDSNSDGICDVCDRVLGTHQHSFGTEWKSDASQHWHECACGEKGSVGDHIDTNKDGKCDFCGANVPLPPHEHSFESKWTYDAENHWHKCTGCDEVSNKGAHVDANNDGICDLCNYDKLPITPTVVSVRVSGDTSVYATKTIQLTATVEVQGTASKDVTWSSSNNSFATVSESGLVTGVEQGRVTITATSVFDNTKKGELVVTIGPAPTISYVEFETKDQNLNLNETLALEYKVASVSEADDSVTFSSNNPEVATVSESGLVNALAEGEAIITVASVFDPTKTDTVTLNVIDMGFSKELYQLGYTFTREYPADLIKEFIGEGEYSLYEFPASIAAYGFYYDVVEEEGYIPYFELVFNFETEEQAEEIYVDLEDETKYFGYFDVVYYTDEFLDITNTYEISINEIYDEEYTYDFYEFQFYKASDLYDGSPIQTSETAFKTEDENAIIEVLGTTIPFPQFGEDYIVDAEPETEEESAYVMVVDFSYNHALSKAYEAKLEGEGFVYDESEGAWTKPIDDYNALYIQVFFCSYGNTISAYVGPRTYDAFPESVVNAFISTQIGSKFTAIPLVADDCAFRYTELESDEMGKYCYVSGLPVDQDTFYEYAAEYTKAGYELLEYSQYDEELGSIDAMLFVKGKLGVYLELDPELVIDWDTFEMYYDLDNSTCFVQYFLYDEEASEEKGLYLSVNEFEITTAETYIVCPQLIDLGNPELTFTSSDEEIATVDEYGEVTFLAAGDVTITVSTKVESVDYSASILFHVTAPEVPGVTFDFAEITDSQSYEIDGFKYQTATGTNPNKQNPQYNADKAELRLYIGNTITFTSEEPMTSIFFDANTCGETKADGTLTCDVGEIEEVDGGFYWEGNATEVTFSVDSGKQVHINVIDINGGGEGGGGGGQEELAEWPAAQIAACLEGGTDVVPPAADGTSFTFKEDEEYNYDCYVDVYGGDILSYLDELEKAGYTVTDETEEYGCFSAVAPDQTLEIDVYDYGSYFELDIYACQPALEEFPLDEVKAFLTSVGVSTQSFPIPEGDEFYAGEDGYGGYQVDVVGGDCDAYIQALESAGYDIDDSYADMGYYMCYKGDLEIDVSDYEEEGFSITFGEIWSLEE